MNTLNDEEDFSQPPGMGVPDDFPRPYLVGSISGAQPKLLLTIENGIYYNASSTPGALTERWNYCNDLALQFSEASKKSKAGKRSHMAEEEILDQYLKRLITTRWTSHQEAKWVIRRCATLLGWTIPAAAAE